MSGQTLMLIGGSDRTNGDYSWLLRHPGISTTWSCPKGAQVRDNVLIYIAAPISQVVATAKVIRSSRPGAEVNSDWRYVGVIGPIRLLSSPISLAELRTLCPGWAWLRYPRAYAYVPEAETKTLRERAQLKTPPPSAPSSLGAGFGDPETNRLIEKASVEAVTRFFERQGFDVRSRESECLGYDLDVMKARRTLHVEVKGVAGDIAAFPVTAGEVRFAKGPKSKSFRLAVVTNALSKVHRCVEVITAKQFFARFALREINFMASPRSNGRK